MPTILSRGTRQLLKKPVYPPREHTSACIRNFALDTFGDNVLPGCDYQTLGLIRALTSLTSKLRWNGLFVMASMASRTRKRRFWTLEERALISSDSSCYSADSTISVRKYGRCPGETGVIPVLPRSCNRRRKPRNGRRKHFSGKARRVGRSGSQNTRTFSRSLRTCAGGLGMRELYPPLPLCRRGVFCFC